MHPGAWLVWAATGGIIAASTTNPFYLLPLAVCAAAVHAVHGGAGSHVRSFKVFVMFGLFALVTRTALVVFGEVSWEATAAAALEGLRLAVLLTIFGTFNSVSDPFGVLKLAPRRFHEPALAASLALSIAPRTIDAAIRVREAQRLRGADLGRWRSWGSLAVPVLENGMEEAVTLAESMDARGHGRGPRTRYRPQSWEARAWATSIACLVAVVVLFAVSRDAADMSFTTYPLRWPAAHFAILGAVLCTMAPAFLPSASESR